MGKNLLERVYTPADQTVRPAWMIWAWAVALLCQVGQRMLYWTWSGPDRNRQLVAAKMANEGHGLSEPTLDALTGAIHYEPLVSWAPGYSRLAGILEFIFNDWGAISQAISVLAILFVFAGLYWLFYQLRSWFPWRGEVFLLLLWACSFTPFQHFTDTDLLSLGAAIFASALLLRNQQYDWLAATAMLFIAAWFRIAYVPFMLVPPVWTWWKLASWKPSRTVYASFITSVICIISYSLLFSPSHPVSGSVENMLSFGTFYPENLLNWDAFPVKSWVYISAEGIRNKFGALASMMVSGVFIVFSIAFFYRLGKGWLDKHSGEGAHPLSSLLILVLSLTCMLLGWLSLRTPAELHDGVRMWTYVQETRYYGWTLILIEIWTIALLFRQIPQEFTRRIIRISLLLALGFGMIHGLYRHSAALLFPQHIGTRLAESEQRLFSIMDQVSERLPDGPTYLIPGEDIFSRDQVSLGILAGGILAYDLEGIPADAHIIDLRSN